MNIDCFRHVDIEKRKHTLIKRARTSSLYSLYWWNIMKIASNIRLKWNSKLTPNGAERRPNIQTFVIDWPYNRECLVINYYCCLVGIKCEYSTEHIEKLIDNCGAFITCDQEFVLFFTKMFYYLPITNKSTENVRLKLSTKNHQVGEAVKKFLEFDAHKRNKIIFLLKINAYIFLFFIVHNFYDCHMRIK